MIAAVDIQGQNPAPAWWDISPPVQADSPLFPGDTAFVARWVSRIGPECPVNVSALSLSPHIGAHADAPLHYDAQGAAPAALDLTPYLGHCRVIHALHCGPLVQLHHLQHALHHLPSRVLVRTYQTAPTQFDLNLPGFAPATLSHLADLGVQLVGIDSASVDPAASKLLPSHQVLQQRGMRVLENLLLDDVAEGDYELIALPLKLVGVCASPVRAILRPWPPYFPTSPFPIANASSP